eukprot:gene11869-8463_t
MNMIKEHLLGWKRSEDDVFANGRVVVHNSLRANEDGDTAYTLVVGSVHIPLLATMQMRPTLAEFQERRSVALDATLATLCSAVNDVAGDCAAAAADAATVAPPTTSRQPAPPVAPESREGRTLRRSSSFSFLRSLSRSRSSSRAPSPAKGGANSRAASPSPTRRSGSFSFSFAGSAPPATSAAADHELTVTAKDSRSVSLSTDDAAVCERWHVALREALGDLLFARCFRLCRQSAAGPGEEAGLELSLRKLEIGLQRGALLLPPQHCHLLRARRLRNVKTDLVEIARRLRVDAQCLSDEEVRAFLKRADCDRLVLLDADFVRLQAMARAHVFLPAAALRRLRCEGHVDVPLHDDDAVAFTSPSATPDASPATQQRRSGSRRASPTAASPVDRPTDAAAGDAAPSTPDALFLVSISSPRTTQSVLAPPASTTSAATGSSKSSRRSARLSTPPAAVDADRDADRDSCPPRALAVALDASPVADAAALWRPRPSATPSKLPSPKRRQSPAAAAAAVVVDAAVHRQLQRCLRELRGRRRDADDAASAASEAPPSPLLRCDALFVTPSASVDLSGLTAATALGATDQATQVTPSLALAAAGDAAGAAPIDATRRSGDRHSDGDEAAALTTPTPTPCRSAGAAHRYDATVADGEAAARDALVAAAPSTVAAAPLTPPLAAAASPSPASLATVSPLTPLSAQDEATSTDDLAGFLAAQPLRLAAPELAQIDAVLELLDELSQSASASLSQRQRPPSVIFVGGGGGCCSVLSAGGVSGLFDDDDDDAASAAASAAVAQAASASSSGVLHYSASLLGDSPRSPPTATTATSPALLPPAASQTGDSDGDSDDVAAVLGRLRFPATTPFAAAPATSPQRRPTSAAKRLLSGAGDASVDGRAENDARGGNGPTAAAASPAKRPAPKRPATPTVTSPPRPTRRLQSELSSARDRVSLLSDRLQRVRSRLSDAQPPDAPLAASVPRLRRAPDAAAAAESPSPPPTAASSVAVDGRGSAAAGAAATRASLGALVVAAALALAAWLVVVGHRAATASLCPRAALSRPPPLSLRAPTRAAPVAASVAARRSGRFALPPALRTAPPSPSPAAPAVERLLRDVSAATVATPKRNGAAAATRLLRSVRDAVTRGVWRLVRRAIVAATLMPPEHQQLLLEA